MSRNKGLGFLLCLCFAFCWQGAFAFSVEREMGLSMQKQKKEDAEQLAKALDYYMSNKYHECMLILGKLDKAYRLNPRYRAYLGVCYFYEWEYEQAVKCLNEAIPRLVDFAPQERAFYYWIAAECYFSLQQYENALARYEKVLSLCQVNEQADVYYRLGFCHLFKYEENEENLEERNLARECMQKALDGYLKYRDTPEEKARIAQIKNMIKGLTK